MLFNSYSFAVLVVVTFCLYYAPWLGRHQLALLIGASVVFYGSAQPYLLLLLFVSASTNALTSFLVFHADGPQRKRRLAVAGVTFNLLVLAAFKYHRLLDEWLPSGMVGNAPWLTFLIQLPLPIGISFYTFEGISLIMDIYKPVRPYGLAIDQRFGSHYAKTLLFIVFFPHLVAGPILKAHEFFPQIARKYLSHVDLSAVSKAIITGYFLKSVVADNLKEQTFWIAAPYFENLSSLTLVVMLYGYSMQIFADFAGYSLIAIGVAALFGYQLPQNFNFPYAAQSITEFWQRWHISLSAWLKEYLYITCLGGNRKGRVRTYVNLVLVMCLGGLWHGAATSYGVWGLWHGLGLAAERYATTASRRPVPGAVASWLRIAGVFTFVSVGWLLFKLTTFSDALRYLGAIRENTSLAHGELVIVNIALYSVPVVAYHAVHVLRDNARLRTAITVSEPALYTLLAVAILINGGIPGEFVYFQF